MQDLDPHQRPPEGIRSVYKKYQKMKLKELDRDQGIIDVSSHESDLSSKRVRIVKSLAREDLASLYTTFAGENREFDSPSTIPVYEHEDMPGKGTIHA